jgi:hypothetical protein
MRQLLPEEKLQAKHQDKVATASLVFQFAQLVMQLLVIGISKIASRKIRNKT